MPKKKESPFYYGGQAVMEGVMMRGKSSYVMAVRKSDGGIETIETPAVPFSKKHPVLRLPLIRGVVSFVDSFAMGIKTLTKSAEIAADSIETEEEPSKFEKYLQNKFGDKLNKIIMNFGVVVAVAIALVVFMLFPAWIGSLITPLLNGNTRLTGVVEGLVRVAVFVAYVWVISFSKDIRRVFAYHGAEHKTINCHEKGMPLTIENVKNHSRMHKRCGTSFLLVVMLIGMILFIFIRTPNIWVRFASRIALLPLIAGLAYEISVKWAGRRDNALVRAVIFPGICLQKLTTSEPDEGQIETAITALTRLLDAENAEAKTEPETTGVESPELKSE